MPSSIFDDLDLPPIAKLLGWSLLDIDSEAGTIQIAFNATEQFTNPAGHIQGGILAAMLDDTLGPALFAMLGGACFGTTIDLHTHFLRPVPPGRVTTFGKVTKAGRHIGYMEGHLIDPTGKLAARATASAYLQNQP